MDGWLAGAVGSGNDHDGDFQSTDAQASRMSAGSPTLEVTHMKETNFAAHIAEELRNPVTRILVGSTGSGYRAAIAAALRVGPTLIYEPPTK
ncbi:hypothetical protein BCCH1_80100 (plasmid) [Burkholderia contaminans]|jgi:signal transduction histidine kinase|uniref:Uncharacterized protein n=3 Tax=Burkholderia cepacia complex TaxID=87882 RepID=A0A286P6N5_9BURK|nr:hypothetical protein BCCH1_80100 [Burkholderia contaminans]